MIEYGKALKIKPNSDIYFNKAVVLDDMKRFKEAVTEYDKAIKYNPNHKAYYNKAISLTELERY